MQVGKMVKRRQPKTFKKLLAMCQDYQAEDARLTEAEVKELMRHRHYVRGRGGAVRQVGRG